MSYFEHPKRSSPPKESRHHGICPECDQLVIIAWAGRPMDWRWLPHMLGKDGYCVASNERVDEVSEMAKARGAIRADGSIRG